MTEAIHIQAPGNIGNIGTLEIDSSTWEFTSKHMGIYIQAPLNIDHYTDSTLQDKFLNIFSYNRYLKYLNTYLIKKVHI